MSLTALNNATQAVARLKLGSGIIWEPGDATRYWTTLVTMDVPDGFSATIYHFYRSGLLVGMDEGLNRNDALFIRQPQEEYQRWKASKWVDGGYPLGWWAGLRPLLSALEWVAPEETNTRYNPQAAIDIGKLL